MSALKSNKDYQGAETLEDVESYERDGSRIMFLNMIGRMRLPVEFAQCDVLYVEPSWRSGVKEFGKRAGLPVEFIPYIKSIIKCAVYAQIPTYIVSGKEGQKFFKGAGFSSIDILLNGGKSKLYMINHEVVPEGETSMDAIEWLAQRYSCVGDFSCGFGRSGRIFKEQGKRFVMSDINKKCLSAIKMSLMS